MPITMTVTDLQRNIGSVYEQCQRTREPIYITRNGHESLVVMSAESFEEQMEAQRLLSDREMRTLRALLESEREIAQGRTVSLEEARRLRASR